MQNFNLSLLSLIAILSFSQPSFAQVNPKTKDAPKPLPTKTLVTYRVISIAEGFLYSNLYTTNDPKSPIVKVFTGGERVKEIETKGTMMKVTFENVTGWINLR